jgi:exodeoxyribonuclease VII large subunit
MERAFSSQLDRIASRLDYLERRLSARRMYALVSEQRLRLDLLSERLVHSESEIVRQQRQRLEVACGRLSANSPLAILSRGYCIAMDQKGGVIMRSSDAMPGEKIRLLLSDGFIKCQVLEDEAKGA